MARIRSVKPRLLIVDDEPDMLDFLERVFRNDYEVVRAAGAEEALVALEGSEFQVLVTDQKMPRMTGLELLDRINDQYPSLVRVLLSGFTDVPEIQRAIERCGIHNYVVKPVDSGRLRAAVEDAISVKCGGEWPSVD
ncbi:MAG: response regulator [Deltaproteobacteria bacterium]|nr:response regulator [Deltaproteobacteria bacterium]